MEKPTPSICGAGASSEPGAPIGAQPPNHQTLELDPELKGSTEVWPFLIADDAVKTGILDDIAHHSPWDAAKKDQMTAAITAIWKEYPVTSTSTDYFKLREHLEPSGHYPPPIAFDHARISPKLHSPITLTSNENQVLIEIAHFRIDNIKKQLDAEKKSHDKKHLKLHSLSSTPPSGVASTPSRRSDVALGNLKILAWGGNTYNEVWHGDPKTHGPIADTECFGHTDLVYRAMLACGRSQAEALEVASHAMDPDGDFYGPPIIDAVLHGHDHYLNPDFNTGRSTVNAQTAANAARGFVVGHPQRHENLGRASHYLTDLSNPMHTGWEVQTVADFARVHTMYEAAIGVTWARYSGGYTDTIHNRRVFRSCFDPTAGRGTILPAYNGQTGVREGATALARHTHQYLNQQFNQVLQKQTLEQIYDDAYLPVATRDCLTQGYEHCIRLVKYVYNH